MDADPTLFGLSALGWERIDVAGLIILTIGAALEIVADFGERFRYFPTDKRRLEKRAATALLFGLGLEIVATLCASYLNAQIIEQERLARATLERQTLELRLARLPRIDFFDRGDFLRELQGKPTGTVALLYQPNDEEAWALATLIGSLLRAPPPDGAGWKVPTEPAPIPSTSNKDEPRFAQVYPNEPPAIRYGAHFGVSIFCRSDPPPGRYSHENITARGALIWALSAGLGGITQVAEPSLPDDSTFTIIIGPKS